MTARYIALPAALATFLALPAAAQDMPETTLRVADSYPTSHVISQRGAQVFIDKVEELSDGRVTIEFFPAQQLGKAADMLRLLQTGVADIASVGPAYVSDRMPLSDVAALPGMFENVCAGSAAYQTVASEGVLATEEFQPNQIRVLFTGLMPPYQIITTRTEVSGLSDLEGLKIRASGGSSQLMVQALGGVPVSLAGPDIREGLDRGTVDANLGPNSSLRPYDIFPLAKFGTQGFPFGSFVLTYSVSEATWNQLDPAVQNVLTEAAAAAQAELCAAMEEENKLAITDMEGMGSKFHYATDEDLAELQALTDQVIKDWTDGLEGRGRPAAQAIEEFRAALGD